MSGIYAKKVIIALGHFDSIHVGHRAVIERAVLLSKSQDVFPAVFLFDGDLKSTLNKSNHKPVYSLDKRIEIIKNLGVDDFYTAPTTKEFLSLEKDEFLDKLNEKFDILGYVCGDDFRFGKNASGNVSFLGEYAKEKGQTLDVIPIISLDGKKVSSTLIKEFILDGKIEKANELLVSPYSVSGEVVKDRGVGKKIGFPTVNIIPFDNLIYPKDGVYYGKTTIDFTTYKCVINLGARPTFNNAEKVLEAHIIGFNGDLYGKTVSISFDGYLRDIYKFSSIDELKNQLTKDVKKVQDND